MRLLAFGLTGLLSTATAGWACPDAGRAVEVISYDAAAVMQGQTLSLTAGGTHALAACDLGALGVGWFRAAPDYRMDLSDAADRDLVLAVAAECDTGLLVRTADGHWRFNDDGNGNLDPRLTLAAGQALDGMVDVWVGSFDAEGCPADMQLATAQRAAPITPFARGPARVVPSIGGGEVQVQAQAPQPAPLPMPIPAPLPSSFCPNPSLIGPSLYLSGPQLLAPQAYVAQLGTGNDIDDCPGIDGYGRADPAPSFTLYMSQMDGYQFTAEMSSDCDPTLIIRDAYGQWHFNDDGPAGLQPQLVLNGAQLNGRVDVWVGNYGDYSCQGTIVFRTASSMVPNVPMNGMPGCPNPALQGMPVTTTGGALYSPTTYSVSAGGMQDVSYCGLPIYATGYFPAQPNLSFFLSGMQNYGRLEIQGQSGCDTVLLVRTPDGNWYFDDDSNGNLNPMLDIYGAGRLNGRVDVWVGTYSSGGNCNASIEMETWNN